MTIPTQVTRTWRTSPPTPQNQGKGTKRGEKKKIQKKKAKGGTKKGTKGKKIENAEKQKLTGHPPPSRGDNTGHRREKTEPWLGQSLEL